ncbi:hypothetical protein ES705_05491 [subsurface metagenome]
MNNCIKEQKDKINAAVENLFKELQAGKSDNLKKYLEFAAQFHTYSFMNTMLIWTQNPEATHVAGLRQWNEKDFWVKKGSKAIKIFAPQIAKYYCQDEDKNSRMFFGQLTKKQRKEIENNPNIDVYEKLFFRVVNVFDIGQCENKSGKEIPQFFYNVGNNHKDKYLKLKAIMESQKIKVTAKNGKRAEGTSYGGKVELKEERDYDNKLLILIHEFAHEILHQNKKGDIEILFSTEVKEVQAEAVSYIVSHFLGVHNPFSSDYILHWGKDKKILRESLEVVIKASNKIIGLIKGNREERKVA